MSSVSAPTLLDKPSVKGIAKEIEERLSQELVIALIGPVASGVSTASQFISEILTTEFGYLVAPIIKPSAIIKDEAHRVGIKPPELAPLHQYILGMQDAGNALREKFGNNYLAEKTVERIYKFRKEKGGLTSEGTHVPGRRAYIIDSLKSPEELELLRDIYGETLCVFGVFAPDMIRRQRLKNNSVPDDQIDPIISRDKGEVITFGQKTRKIFVDADFFINNDHKKDELRRKISRYINVIFNTEIHTPTRSETAMYEATSASARSACMSRQVGAAIVSKTGELISIGWNDVPRFGGGLYNEDDQFHYDESKNAIIDEDHRCFKWDQCVCHNEVRRRKIIENIAKGLQVGEVTKKGVKTGEIIAALKNSEVNSLIEFSRSIHAEMEAILSVAREGRHSLVGATLYTNTYPCHNCARHIVASGIVNVFYIQPYEKSLAIALHNDAITEDPDDNKRVRFRQYDGVAPRNLLRLFAPKAERKKDGAVMKPSRKHAVPLFRVLLDAPADYEAKVVADLDSKEQSPPAG